MIACVAMPRRRDSEPSPLSPEERSRYGRHLVLPEVGLAGQTRLRDASVLIVGAGGLGAPLAIYLAAAGVGRIGLVDFDTVELSNLQRQVLYCSRDVDRPKVEAARDRMIEINPHVTVDLHPTRFSADNAQRILTDYEVVADGSDNFSTRYLVNDACVLSGKPNVYGSIYRFEGQLSVFGRGDGPCYRCLYPEPPEPGAVPNCAEGGVLGVLPGVIGTLQATETIKLLLGRGEPLVGRLLLFDALEMRFRELRLRRDPSCPVCGDEPTIRELVEIAETCEAPTPPTDGAGWEISPAALHARDARDAPLLLDVRTPEEWEICRLEDARLIPLHELPQRVGELSREREIVVYCHTGGRSSMAVRFLREQGFGRARNLTGGIDAWAGTLDPTMPRY